MKCRLAAVRLSLWKVIETGRKVWVGRTNQNWGGCHVGVFSGKSPESVRKTNPRGDFVISINQVNKIDILALDSKTIKKLFSPTSETFWLWSSRKRSVLRS